MNSTVGVTLPAAGTVQYRGYILDIRLQITKQRLLWLYITDDCEVKGSNPGQDTSRPTKPFTLQRR